MLFSLVEPHGEWIQKGKERPTVELGHIFLIATGQQQLIHDYDALLGNAEVKQSLPVTDRLLDRCRTGRVVS